MSFVSKLDKNQIKLFAMLNFKNIFNIKVKRYKNLDWKLFVKTEDFEKEFILSDFECRTLPLDNFYYDISYCAKWKTFLYNLFKEDYRIEYNKYLHNKVDDAINALYNKQQSINNVANLRIEAHKKDLEMFAANIDLHYSPAERKAMVEEYRHIIREEEKKRDEELERLASSFVLEKELLKNLRIYKCKHVDLEK